MDRLSGKVAVVTGAGSGIGRALVRRFHHESMLVIAADIDGDALHALEHELHDRVITHRADVQDPDAVEALANQAFDEAGAVHVVCNNAGVTGASPAPVWTVPLQTWHWVLGVNLMGIVHGQRSFIPRMLASGQAGHIVNTASLSGLVSFPNSGAYGPSKHAAVALSETTALDLAARGAPIGVSVLCPAWVDTGILDDERHRPDSFRVEPDEVMPDAVRADLALSMQRTAISPTTVADAVIDAILTNRFAVLPNPEWTQAITDRAHRLSNGTPAAAASPSVAGTRTGRPT